MAGWLPGSLQSHLSHPGVGSPPTSSQPSFSLGTKREGEPALLSGLQTRLSLWGAGSWTGSSSEGLCLIESFMTEPSGNLGTFQANALDKTFCGSLALFPILQTWNHVLSVHLRSTCQVLF